MTGIYRSPGGEQAIKDRYLGFLKHWPVPNQHLEIPTCEGETFVIACGPESAPPLLLLHGASFNSAMWMGDVSAWSAHFRVYAIDIIGDAGLSAPSRPSYASEASASWLDDVMAGLGIDNASLIGISLGGWIALDYAIRRASRVRSLVAIAPGGIASRNVLLWALPLLLLGPWGRRKMTEIIGGPASANPSPTEKAVADFMALVFRNMRPRMQKFPIFGDAGLRKPIMAILGGKDVFIDSPRVKARLESNVANVSVRYLPESRHAITNQTAPILDFLRAAHAS